MHYVTELDNLAYCPECGSDDLGFFGSTDERTEADITDLTECAHCHWEGFVESDDQNGWTMVVSPRVPSACPECGTKELFTTIDSDLTHIECHTAGCEWHVDYVTGETVWDIKPDRPHVPYMALCTSRDDGRCHQQH